MTNRDLIELFYDLKDWDYLLNSDDPDIENLLDREVNDYIREPVNKILRYINDLEILLGE